MPFRLRLFFLTNAVVYAVGKASGGVDAVAFTRAADCQVVNFLLMSSLYRHTRTNPIANGILVNSGRSLTCLGCTVDELSYAIKVQHRFIFDMNSPFFHSHTYVLLSCALPLSQWQKPDRTVLKISP